MAVISSSLLGRAFLATAIVALSACEQPRGGADAPGTGRAVASSSTPGPGCDLAADFPVSAVPSMRPRHLPATANFYGLYAFVTPEVGLHYECTCTPGVRPDMATRTQAEGSIFVDMAKSDIKATRAEYAETTLGKRVTFEGTTPSPVGELVYAGHLYLLSSCAVAVYGVQLASARTRTQYVVERFLATVRKGRPGGSGSNVQAAPRSASG